MLLFDEKISLEKSRYVVFSLDITSITISLSRLGVPIISPHLLLKDVQYLVVTVQATQLENSFLIEGNLSSFTLFYLSPYLVPCAASSFSFSFFLVPRYPSVFFFFVFFSLSSNGFQFETREKNLPSWWFCPPPHRYSASGCPIAARNKSRGLDPNGNPSLSSGNTSGGVLKYGSSNSPTIITTSSAANNTSSGFLSSSRMSSSVALGASMADFSTAVAAAAAAVSASAAAVSFGTSGQTPAALMNLNDDDISSLQKDSSLTGASGKLDGTSGGSLLGNSISRGARIDPTYMDTSDISSSTYKVRLGGWLHATWTHQRMKPVL